MQLQINLDIIKIRQRYLHITQNKHDKKSHTHRLTDTGWKISWKIRQVLYSLGNALCWKYSDEKQGKRQIHKNMQSRLATHTHITTYYSQSTSEREKVSLAMWTTLFKKYISEEKKNGSKAKWLFFSHNKHVTANSTQQIQIVFSLELIEKNI